MMDEQTKRLVEEAETRAVHAPTRDPSTWELFVADVIVGSERIGDTIAYVTECVGIERAEAEFLEHAPSDVLALCAKVRELSERVEELETSEEQWQEYEASALRRVGEEVVQGRTCERGELVYWINQIHEHYREKIRELEYASKALRAKYITGD